MANDEDTKARRSGTSHSPSTGLLSAGLPQRLATVLERLSPAIIDPLLTTEETAAYVGATPRTLEAWRVRGGGPPFVKVSRRMVRYRLSDLAAWVEERLQTSTSSSSTSG
ncbi:MAG: helix-turn-helix domain-containing protein [bacterium]|nr:helix-turn-helix domain-containing protein [bacterium]